MFLWVKKKRAQQLLLAGSVFGCDNTKFYSGSVEKSSFVKQTRHAMAPLERTTRATVPASISPKGAPQNSVHFSQQQLALFPARRPIKSERSARRGRGAPVYQQRILRHRASPHDTVPPSPRAARCGEPRVDDPVPQGAVRRALDRATAGRRWWPPRPTCLSLRACSRALLMPMLRPPRLTPARDARIAMRRLPRRGARAVALALRAAPRSRWVPTSGGFASFVLPSRTRFLAPISGGFRTPALGFDGFYARTSEGFGWPRVSSSLPYRPFCPIHTLHTSDRKSVV